MSSMWGKKRFYIFISNHPKSQMQATSEDALRQRFSISRMLGLERRVQENTQLICLVHLCTVFSEPDTEPGTQQAFAK